MKKNKLGIFMLKKCNIFRYYYHGHIFGCDITDMTFKEAVKAAYNIHIKQCKIYNLVVDLCSKELIISELKKLYNL